MDGLLIIFLFLLSFAITIGVVLYILDNQPKDDTTKTTEVQYVLTPSTYGWAGWNDYYGWNYGKRPYHRRRYH